MTRNVGQIDRIARIVVGLGLLIGFVLNPGGSFSWLYLIGIVPLATGLMRSCPAYSIFGISTCPLDKSFCAACRIDLIHMASFAE